MKERKGFWVLVVLGCLWGCFLVFGFWSMIDGVDGTKVLITIRVIGLKVWFFFLLSKRLKIKGFHLFLIVFNFFFFFFFQADRILQGQNEGEEKVFEFWLFWPVFHWVFWFLVFDQWLMELMGQKSWLLSKVWD
jgi:hypothetical protein